MIYRFRDRWYQAAHDPSLGTGDLDTFQVQKTQYESKSKMQREWERQVKVGMPHQLMSSLVGFMTMIFQWSIPDIWWVERYFHLILYHEKKHTHTFGIREHEANEDFQVWRISFWMVYFLPSPVEFPRNARRFWGQCRWASRWGRQDFWHSVGCIMDSGHVEILGSSRGLPWFHRPWPDVGWLVELSNCRCLVGATLVICQAWLEVALVDTSW